MQQHLAHFAIDRHVEQNDLVDAVVIVLVMWIILIVPLRRAGIRVACENAVGPFIVARPLFLVPRAGVRRFLI